jgi:hypothetical protein
VLLQGDQKALSQDMCAGRAAPLIKLPESSLEYAAPDVVKAVAAGRDSIVADAAFDAWALGAVAYELLTKTCVWSGWHGMTPGERDELIKKRNFPPKFPWEVDGAPALPDAVRSCLRTENAHRPKMKALAETAAAAAEAAVKAAPQVAELGSPLGRGA